MQIKNSKKSRRPALERETPKEKAATLLSPKLTLFEVLDALPFYVLLIDEDHHILMANNAVRTQFELETESIIGKYCPEVIHGIDKPIDVCPLEKSVKSGNVEEAEILDPNSGRWIKSVIYPIRSETKDGKKIFFHMISDITDQKLAQEQLITSQKQLRNLSQHIESVREEEKTHIAREIHDELGQLLTGLKMDMSWLIKRLIAENDQLVAKVKVMDALIEEAMQAVKRVSAELRPSVLDRLGLPAAIEWLAQETKERTGINFDLSLPEDINLDDDRSTALFRICQESLTNVTRHANASKVRISLKCTKGRIVLKVKDNGKGISEEQINNPTAFGLTAIIERAGHWGGEAVISRNRGTGTTIKVSIPLAKVDHD